MKRMSLPVTVLVWIVGLTLAWLIAAEPFKVTDPRDPRFDPDRFRFSDYLETDSRRPTWGQMDAAFAALFPSGVSRDVVERVLVNAGRAHVETGYGPSLIIYQWTYPLLSFTRGLPVLWWDYGGATLSVMYDASGHAVALEATHSGFGYEQARIAKFLDDIMDKAKGR